MEWPKKHLTFLSLQIFVQHSAVEEGEGGQSNAPPLYHHPVEGLYLYLAYQSACPLVRIGFPRLLSPQQCAPSLGT
jgi:hypothetical protein